MTRTIYVDASALLKLVIEEPESWVLSESLRTAALVSSDVSRVELRRVLLRLGLGTEPLGLAVRTLSRIELLRVDDVILDRAGEVPPPGLRTRDAIHLASALALGRDLDALVTYDRRLGGAAASHGIVVEAPA